MTRILLRKSFFAEREQEFLTHAGMTATLFRYDSGIEAVRLTNRRGHLVVLPFFGQMVWDAVFDGVTLGMSSPFPMPVPASDITGTYGSFVYHAGLLGVGPPGPEDSHPLHGEMPCAPMTGAALEAGADEEGPWLRLTGHRDYAVAFGPCYRARPSVTLRADRTLFDIAMSVENRSGKPMDLMYLCHVNFAFCNGARIVQPTAFSPCDTVVRSTVPRRIAATPDYLALIRELEREPGVMEVLDQPERYDPQQVFFLRNLRVDAEGMTQMMMRRREGDGFLVRYRPRDFPHTIRWVLHSPDQKACGFAMPATCELDGHAGEKRKGHVRALAPGAVWSAGLRLGYLPPAEADRAEEAIRNLAALD